MEFEKVVTTEKELRQMIGYPGELVQNKTISHLDEHCVHFVSQSPMLFLATASEDGSCDVSPRGDAPGFVHVIGQTDLVIPERPGNRRADSLTNLLTNPRVGLIFLIPGLEETLRVNGSASIVHDEAMLEQMTSHGKKPLLGIHVKVDECFVHCAKSFRRSKLWDDESRMKKEELPNVPQMLASHANLPHMNADGIADALEESYRKRLY